MLSGGQSLLPLLKLRIGLPRICRHRKDSRTGIHQGGRWISQDRRPNTRICARAIRSDQIEISDSLRYGPGHRGPAGPQPRDDRRQPGARRSRQRSSGDDARARRRGDGNRTKRPADDQDREFFTGIFSTALAPDEILTRSAFRSLRPKWRRLREAGAQGWRLCDRRGGCASDVERERGNRTGRHRADERGAYTAQGR